ncbi:MAG TPA: sulfurtransferase [Chloroflexota bacterium]|nr:sulfurtransferase [Chloroflexota bacterium]
MANLVVSLSDLDALDNARLIDARWKLGAPDAGRAMFEHGHIPGAVYVDMDQDLADPPGIGGRHPLPSVERFEQAMSRAGVAAETFVVAYDDGGAGAARLWWLLRHFGHPGVAVLDGGFPAWAASGRPVETGPGRAAAQTHFHAIPRADDLVADTDALRHALDHAEIHLLDARAPERWRGDVEPVDRIPGRIPGAISAPAADNLRSAAFRSPDELRRQYEALGVLDGKPIVVACGSGVSACVDLVALELAGITGARLFPASYSGWLARGLPVQTGPA